MSESRSKPVDPALAGIGKKPLIDRIGRARLLAGAVLGVTALVLYTITLAPDILAHDVADWQGSAAVLGLSHNPGSPVYIFLAWLFTLVPLGGIAERVNFLSAVVGAAGVLAIYIFILMLFDHLLPAIIGSISLMVAAQWWSYASLAQPYSGVVLIIIILLIMLILWQRKGNPRLVWGGAFVFGLGLVWHSSLVMFLPVLVAGVFIFGPWRKLLAIKPLLLTLLFFLVGFAFYAYLPIRSAADPPIMYGKVDSLSSLRGFMTAADTRSGGQGTFALPQGSELREALVQVVRKGYYPSYAFLVFGPAVLLLYPPVRRSLKPRRRWLLFLAGGMVVQMFLVFAMSQQYSQYYMPMLLYFSVWVSFSVYLLLKAARTLGAGRYGQAVAFAAGAIYLVVLAMGVSQPRIWEFVDHSHDVSMRRYTDEVFRAAEPGAVVLADWESYTALLYAQKVDGQRPDLTLVSVVPRNWRQELTKLGDRQAQMLYSHTLPLGDAGGLPALTEPVFVSIKGRTYQDRSQGEPYPAAVQLFQVHE
ncbi:hypothetical protein BMS3Abin01_01371 [bacterium BMS3Abin01]|nr:hypothetical protein BMS3Abin01_01371 [bacterium BMS3Abin01]